MTCAIVSVLGLIFLIGSISATKHPNIIGGTNATIKNFPYLVSLRSLEGRHQCGGAIISETHILTAAHCLEFLDDTDDMRVHTGTSRRSVVGDVHEIQSFDIHPTYDRRPNVTGSDDIAVITLKEPIVFNKYQQKVNLPTHDVQNYQTAYVVGWGLSSYEEWVRPEQMQKLQVVLLPSAKCQQYLTESVIDETQVCAFRSTGKAACYGDSGGPLVSHGELVGVVSRGDTGHCADGIPDIYTNVFVHREFIDSVMNDPKIVKFIKGLWKIVINLFNALTSQDTDYDS